MDKVKMDGVIAQLHTYSPEGKPIGSQIVFRPNCEWYIPELRDGLAETEFTDLGSVIDEFGVEVAEKIIEGEIVDVTREIPEGMYQQVSCKAEKPQFEILSTKIRYPIPDSTKEYLVKKRPAP